MDNVVKLSEELGRRAREQELRKQEMQREMVKKAEIKRFSADGNWTSYHDVITSSGYSMKIRRLAMNRELRKNYGKLVDVLRSYGLLRKAVEYVVSYHEEAQLYEISQAFSGESLFLVKRSECAQVWDWGV